ncbi:MAG: NAD+ synthase [Sphingomonadales bacterium 35-56-22]|jgi:NAD+ synthase|uniref:NAD+ synthase n=1 Tax=Sphingorhabdus sp. TaxID=1902408 RepID=UPI000BD45346|nr:NAD+ synthase [Sphingorhabdus sp.]OYY15001.1 MAG: NAD+ synthase [Sphingomonadales bacterium 35-56-22]OYY96364.1 MAG: NAD+ synthase [Sphingomonadales bacterium 28-56-43]OYZ59971.1 MAG: NAD+ synthase [Sphingomonadales bacterium 24-56-14]OZA82147.1 MAG: NAD+ synthase [Sphingomonadales bacterium 39-57-19]HQS13353.1 NAD+ synthase [Sphingorhabdus sp.]
MTNRLNIAMAQLNQRVGDLAGNAGKMLEWRAKATDADLIVFPEQQLIGYPAEDLVLKPAFAARAAVELAKLAEATADGGPAMLVGSIFLDDGALYNGIALLDGGQIAAVRYKHELPNYGTFDEKRIFASGPMPEPMLFKGVRIGVPICEDGWLAPVSLHLKERGAELLISTNGSPYEIDKDDRRLEEVFAARVRETGLPLMFLNRVGGQDELVFDGSSFVLNANGAAAHRLPDWEEHLRMTHWTRGDNGWQCADGPKALWEEHPADIYSAMVTGLRDYVNSNGFPGVVLGMSGGIDSAICAAIAADALGPDRVWCVMLPSRYTSQSSLDDAAQCAEMIGCRIDTIPISPAVGAFDDMLSGSFADRDVDITEENIQSRIRGVTLMALSNKFGHMLLTTGNKSEMSVGYATIYGDMAGGYNPIKDAYKMTVFAISEWRNAHKPRIGLGRDGPVIPDNIITKPPSAELRPDQKDSDSLPDYPVLDKMLHALVEEERSVDEVVAQGFDRDTVVRIERLLYLAEYKRRQAPPGVKLGTRNFGRDRRYPITNAFRSGR